MADLPHETLGVVVIIDHINDWVDRINGAYNPTVLTPPVVRYTVAVAPVQNTVVETLIGSFTVPGGTWNDGDFIHCYYTGLHKQNTGSSRVPVVKVNIGAGAQVTVSLGSNWLDDATEYKVMGWLFSMQRKGSDVWIGAIASGVAFWGRVLDTPSVPAIKGVSTPTNFTGDNLISIKATLDNANANYYMKPQFIYAYRSRVAS